MSELNLTSKILGVVNKTVTVSTLTQSTLVDLKSPFRPTILILLRHCA